jgi:ubiquinol-cytochrome c reductase iron-sulfur subunit
MSETTLDTGKRTWLIATGCAGVAGGAAVAVPFISTFSPSERAKAAGAAVEVDISAIKPGEKITGEWRGKPVWVVRRTPSALVRIFGWRSAYLLLCDWEVAPPSSNGGAEGRRPKN